ncbi:hypothetical protein GCM10009676_18030 [Prauserella halophila]|uniref:Uncharacterized protein n=1 Tax=Prauserella halophila TaxID=185641 RepID=A0ABN1W6G5_9PSEU|nr:hypothetical protein [Prauserella halophila]MCP2235995.1 hypothetical protein [Prauserella halophila]
MATIGDHDSYIAAAPEAFRPVLDRLRDVVRSHEHHASTLTAEAPCPGFA